MRRNAITAIIVLILGSIAAWFYFTNKSGTIKKELSDFAVQDTAAITKIFLADMSGKQVTLTKVVSGEWMVNSKFPARGDAVQTLLYTIKTLDVKEPVGKNGRPNQIKSLSSSGIKVEIYTGEKRIKLYYVGGETQDGTGTYMLLSDPETQENSSIPFIMYIPGFQGYLTPRYFTDETKWRSLNVFNDLPSTIRSVRMESAQKPEKGFELNVKGPNDFSVISLANGKPVEFDTLAVKQYLTYFRWLNAESYLTERELKKEARDSIIAGQPEFTLRVTTHNGKSNTLKAYKKGAGEKERMDVDGKKLDYDPDRMYALINNGNDFVTIQVYSFGKVFMPIDYFLLHQKPVKK